jgi:hypothetical protein
MKAHDEMSLAGIDAKVKELYAKRDKIEAERKLAWDKKQAKPDPEAEKYWREIDDVDLEIRAFKELKAKKIVNGSTDSDGEPPQERNIDEVCQENQQLIAELNTIFSQ